MKTTKYLLLIEILFGLQIQIQANNTDVSTLDNVVYIESFSAPAGSSYTISVKMKNTVDAVGFYFDLILPDGITVPTKSGSSKPMAYLSTERTNSDNTGFIADYKLDGTLQVQAYDNGGMIEGNNGEIATIVINIASDMPEGDYPILLKNTGVVQTNSLPLRTDIVETSITVTAPVDLRLTFDENSDNADVLKDATGVDIKVKRTIKANEWSTICLPFAMSEAQVKAAFGNDVEVADFNDYEYDDTKETINVKFQDVTAIEANHPYIIKVSKVITEFTADGVNIDPQEAIVDFDTSRRKNQPRQMIGTYVANTTLDWGMLFLNSNKFWYSVGNTKMKAFRAYFNFIDLIPDFENNYESRITMSFGNETTSIKETSNLKSQTSNLYDLQGRKVQKPSKGLYIINGRKEVIK